MCLSIKTVALAVAISVLEIAVVPLSMAKTDITGEYRSAVVSAPINMTYTLADSVTVHEWASLRLRLQLPQWGTVSLKQVGDRRVEVDGLEHQYTTDEKGMVVINLNVRSSLPGRHYLKLIARAKIGTTPMTKPLVLIIPVADASGNVPVPEADTSERIDLPARRF